MILGYETVDDNMILFKLACSGVWWFPYSNEGIWYPRAIQRVDCNKQICLFSLQHFSIETLWLFGSNANILSFCSLNFFVFSFLIRFSMYSALVMLDLERLMIGLNPSQINVTLSREISMRFENNLLFHQGLLFILFFIAIFKKTAGYWLSWVESCHNRQFQDSLDTWSLDSSMGRWGSALQLTERARCWYSHQWTHTRSSC